MLQTTSTVKRIRWMTLLTMILLAFSAFVVYPPERSLRLGKDLSGGVSLVYTVQVAPGEDAKSVIGTTIDVLKKRIDPQGVSEISMVQQGRDRIEITMPLPNAEVKAKKAAFEDALNKLSQSAINPNRLDQFMRLPAAERQAKLDELSGGNAGRRELISAAGAAFDESSLRRAEYEKGVADKLPQEEIDKLVGAAAEADLKFEAARDKVLTSAITGAEVRRVLELSDQGRMLMDSSLKKPVAIPSPREQGMTDLRAGHPEFKNELDQIEALYADFRASRRTLDDPADLQRLIKNAGVLSFRITVKPGEDPDEARLRQELRERGPRNVRSTDVKWYRINQIDNWYDSVQAFEFLKASPEAFFASKGYVGDKYESSYYILAYDVRSARLTQADGEWGVEASYEDRDQLGRPAIAFRMDVRGAARLGALTRQHVKDQMAVLLDDEVYTAPTLQSDISKSGQISGDFSAEERQYIVRVLSAGSLQAKLSPEPISISALGPELGADNLEKGIKAGLLSLAVVCGFMIVYYFQCGFIAVLALLCNGLLVLGAMAANKAAFTMPGIAGVILTFGMAVDSNVLIFERMREEFRRGHDMKTAVRLGYAKAFSSILDGNITNLIVCVVLAYTGTQEIKGFAITMSIGVVATLFSALVISRAMFEIAVHYGKWRKTSMLPMAVPALQHFLTPRIRWLRYRYIFFGISAFYVTLGLVAVFGRGPQMLDNEFRGGTQVTLTFKEGPGGERLTMSRLEVEDKVHEIGEKARPGSELAAMAAADVYPLNPRSDGVTSDQFVIKTVSTDQKAVIEAIVLALADKLETKPALEFKGSEVRDFRAGPVYRVTSKALGQDIDRPDVRDDVTRYLGGVAIVLADIQPPPTLQALNDRLDTLRAGSDFSDTLGRTREVKILDGDQNAVRTAVVLVHDPDLSLFDNESRWDHEVAEREWALVGEALTKASLPASVQSFSAAIAETFRAQAIVATILSFLLIGVYIWVRFKGARYSVAAVIALLHDVLTVLGLVALTEYMYDRESLEPIARSLGLLPFKVDLNMVAALLSIAGYSLNDTIIIMDRIRENRGKSLQASSEMINRSINETFSRTLITGGTTMASCLILYIYGGEGVRAFSFTLLTGMIVGTYSSVAVAAPIVWSRKHDRAEYHSPDPGVDEAGPSALSPAAT